MSDVYDKTSNLLKTLTDTDTTKTTRYYCFTSYKDEPPTFDSDKHRCLVFQREVCPITAREHWQGYVEFNNSVRWKAVGKSIGDPTCHVENRKGTRSQAIIYCKKSDTRKEGI